MILAYAVLILGAVVGFADVPEATDCVWNPQVRQQFSFATVLHDRTANRIARATALVMVVSPGLESDVRTYHFWSEHDGHETEIAIEGPFTVDEIKRRFGTALRPYSNATLWVLPRPELEKPGTLIVSARHRESGYNRTTNEPCFREMRRTCESRNPVVSDRSTV